MIQATAKQLLEVVDTAATAVAKNSNFPILEHVMLMPDHGALTAIGSDMAVQVAVMSSIPFDGDGFTVDAEKLRKLLRSLGDTEVSLTFDNDRATLSANRSHYKLNAHRAHDYPVIDDSSELVTAVIVDAEKLRQAIEYVAPAMAKNDVRHVLNGVRLDVAPGRCDVVATDGHRMAHARIEVGGEEDASATIPPRAVAAITKSGLAGQVTLTFRQKTLSVQGGSVRIVTKLIDGQFPDWRRVIPLDHKVRVIVEKGALVKALERVSVTAGDFRSALITLGGGAMRLQTEAMGESGADEIEATASEETEFSAAFNVGYLLDAVRNVKSDEVVMLAIDETRPAVFVCIDTSWETLVMPMRR